MNVHVRVTTKLFGQSPAVTTSVGTPVTVPLQLSSAVNSSATGTSSAQSTAKGPGASTGGPGASVSVTVIVCTQVETPPQASVAVHSLIMVIAQFSPCLVSFNSILTISRSHPCVATGSTATGTSAIQS